MDAFKLGVINLFKRRYKRGGRCITSYIERRGRTRKRKEKLTGGSQRRIIRGQAKIS